MSESPATPLTGRMEVRRPKGTEPAGSTAISDGTMPCPVPSPGGLPCVKHIPRGWTADEGHGGGHFWESPETSQAMERGHFDATAALAGQPFTIHQPEACTPECLYYGKPPGWPLPPTPQAISALRQHVIYCRGCQRAWYDESDDCACVCADPTSPRYEDWVVDPEPQDEPERAWDR